jgi:antirestriction protein ArdC
MKVEQAKRIVSKAIEQLSQALERGHTESLRNYLAAIGRFHRYSLRNVMLIASQKPTATHVAGFHTWHKIGRFVKKGEKGILILAPIVRAKSQSVEQTETDESTTAVGFRAAYVFDISQTDGQELPAIGNVNGDPREYRERLGKFVFEQGILLEYSQDIAPARGTSSGGKITLLPGQSPAEEFATLAHELAHEVMHRDERRCATSKRIRETEAEAVAFVVCSAIGLDTGTAAQDYIGLYGGDAKLLAESLQYVQQASTQILNAIGADGGSASSPDQNMAARAATGVARSQLGQSGIDCSLRTTMPTYEQGDYVKIEFPDEVTGIGEWMWVRVESCDDQKKLLMGRLDNEPLNDYRGKIQLGSELVVSYAQIREHRKPSEFTKQ